MIQAYKGNKPKIHETCFIAKNATIIGDVQIDEHSSVWFSTLIRGDKDKIVVGKHTNIQDQCTLHTDSGHVLQIGDYVSVGHRAIIHGAIIHDHVLIGMGAILMNGANIGANSIVGAGAIVVENQIVPPNSVVVGSPARVIKQCSEEQKKQIVENAQHYVELARDYKMEEHTYE